MLSVPALSFLSNKSNIKKSNKFLKIGNSQPEKKKFTENWTSVFWCHFIKKHFYDAATHFTVHTKFYKDQITNVTTKSVKSYKYFRQCTVFSTTLFSFKTKETINVEDCVKGQMFCLDVTFNFL